MNVPAKGAKLHVPMIIAQHFTVATAQAQAQAQTQTQALAASLVHLEWIWKMGNQ